MDQRAGETSFAAEIKKAEEMRHQRAGETCALWMFTDIYRMQYIKKHMLLHDLIASKFRESTNWLASPYVAMDFCFVKVNT